MTFGENLFTNGVHGRHNVVPASKAFPGIFMVVPGDGDLPEQQGVGHQLHQTAARIRKVSSVSEIKLTLVLRTKDF